MGWTAALVLIALGGAGLATAADRPQTPQQRPELYWHADHVALPWLTQLATQLLNVDAEVGALTEQGAQALAAVQALDASGLAESVAEGDGVAARVEPIAAATSSVWSDAIQAIDGLRVSPTTNAAIEAMYDAVSTSQYVDEAWTGLALDARGIGRLIDALQRHDGLVFRATTAADQQDWSGALDLVAQATDALTHTHDMRTQLAEAKIDTSLLDDLVNRYAAYDEALRALYAFRAEGGAGEGDDYEQLRAAVDAARGELPTDSADVGTAVSAAGAPVITNSLFRLEEARGMIRTAVEAAQALAMQP